MQMVKVRPEIKEIKLHKRKPNHFYGALAQLGERYPCKVEVVGSTPTRSTINLGGYSVVGSGADCKSVAIGSGGSIPSPPTILLKEIYETTSIIRKVNLL